MCILCQLSNLLVRRHGETLFTTEALVDNACGVPAAIFRSFSVLHMQQHLPLLQPSYRAPLHREKGTTDSYLFFFATPFFQRRFRSLVHYQHLLRISSTRLKLDFAKSIVKHVSLLHMYIFGVPKVLKLVDHSNLCNRPLERNGTKSMISSSSFLLLLFFFFFANRFKRRSIIYCLADAQAGTAGSFRFNGCAMISRDTDDDASCPVSRILSTDLSFSETVVTFRSAGVPPHPFGRFCSPR